MKSEETTQVQKKEDTYFAKRMKLYGITHEINTVDIWRLDPEKKENFLKPFEIFQESQKGIDIIVYDLDRHLISYKNNDSRYYKNFKITRLEHPTTDIKGNVKKYNIPKGAGTYPFIPPQLVKKFESDEKIETLVLTEGYFKSFKAAMHGFDCIGLSSITHYKDKETQALHQDIINIIKKKGVKRVVWLVDGDCQDLSQKSIDNSDDLYKRPNQFFNSAKTIKQLLDDYDVDKIFCHIRSDQHKDNPKGLDDLLIAMKGKENEIFNDFNQWSQPSTYFHKIDMTYSSSKVLDYFHLKNVDQFITFQLEHTPALAEALKVKEFVYHGTRYKWDNEKGEATITVPADAKRYFRVGDQYHEKVIIPNKYGQMEHTFHRRQKSTIMDDYCKEIKNFITHIPKYKAFCVVPDHQNYQEVIHSCYNLYAPFEHDPEEGDCAVTLDFLGHIFGTGEITFKNAKTEKTEKIKELDLGLDYIQLLFQRPTQTLPILCLVSHENATGKTTFGKWLKGIFTQNVAIVGNAELSDNFNASWASKLIVICDEAKIDKQIVVEKVKSLSTADKIFMNAKGKDHVEIDFFAKFMFLTNNEENFIYASEEDVRYWIRKVRQISALNITILSDMFDEIPAFLHYLNKRKMVTEAMHRAWFHPDLIKTDALKRVIAYSQSTLEKEIRQHIRDIFLDFPDLTVIEMTKKDIKDEFFRTRNYEMNYLENVITDRLKVKKSMSYVYKEKEYATVEQLKLDFPDVEPVMCAKTTVKRYKYPRWESRSDSSGQLERVRVEVASIGRPFIFNVSDFLLPNEISSRHTSDIDVRVPVTPESKNPPAKQDDLPF